MWASVNFHPVMRYVTTLSHDINLHPPVLPTFTTRCLFYKRNDKRKVCPKTGHEGSKGESRCSSTLSLTSAIDRSGWLTPRPDHFTSGKETQYPLYRRLGGPQDQCGQARKIPPPSGFDSQTVQQVASRYTDWAKRMNKNCKYSLLQTWWDVKNDLQIGMNILKNIKLNTFLRCLNLTDSTII
jgi:hypothetical protein